MKRKAYVAVYPEGHEVIVATDSYWSPRLSGLFDRLCVPGITVQGWYSDAEQVTCMGNAS